MDLIHVNSEALSKAFQLMLFGMGGVFLVLTLLFIVSKVLLKTFPNK